MPDDPFAAYGGHTTDQAPTTQSGSDPFAAFGGRSVSAPTTAQNTQPDPSSQFGGQITSSPVNGQESAAPKFDYQDPNKGWIERGWNWLNTPLTESLFGMPADREGAGGFERGVEHIASGLTSPLSLVLTAATFGTGGFIESLGANTLKEAGLSAAEIADIAKGSEVALNAAKDLKPIEPAINEALANGGHDLDLLQRARNAYAPLNRDAELATDELQSTLSKIGLNQEQRTALEEGKLSAEERSDIASKNDGFSDKELKNLSKTGDTISEAKGNFSPVEDAVRASGVDPDLLKRGQDILRDNGLNEKDLIGGSLLQRGAFQILRKIPELPIAVAAKAAKTAETIMNAGFTYQQLETAAAMSPQFLDALKEGDTDKAWEYGTEAFAGGTLGILGASHALHSAGELFHPLLESDAPRPSDEWQAIQRANGEREALHSVAEQEAIKVSTLAKTLLEHDPARPVIGDSPEVKAKKAQDLATAELGVHTGMDADKAAQWYNALSEAAGKEDKLPVNSPTAYHGTPFDYEGTPKTDGLGAHFTPDKSVAGQIAGNGGKIIQANLGIRNPLRVEDFGGSHTNAEGTIRDFVKKGVLPKSFLDGVDDGALHTRSEQIVGDIGNLQGSELAKRRTDAFNQANQEELTKVKNYLKSKGYDGLVYKNKVEGGGDSYVAFDPKQIHPFNGQLDDQITNNKFKNQTPEYQNRVLTSLKNIAEEKVPDNVKSAIQYLREQQDQNYQISSSNDLLHAYVENHMRRVWKNTNPEGKVISAEAKAGKFATRVTTAQQRVYDSTLTGLLKSPVEMELDPVKSTAEDRSMAIKAAANKQLIDNLRDKFTRASDGRPAVVLSGSGQVISGPDGQDPKTFIDPNRVRKINISNNVIEQLQKSGDLQRYLDEGTIRDITPYVRPDTLSTSIARLEDQAGRQEAKYDAEGNNILRAKIDALKTMQNTKDFSGLKEFNDAQNKVYAWDPQDYISLDHSAMKGWNFVTNDPSGNGIFVKSDIKVHPEFADYLKNRLGLEQSAISKNPIGKALLGVGTKAKETLLSLSPFHMVQEGLRALMVGVNPFHITGPDIENGAKVDPLNPNSPTKIYKGVQNGLTTGTDYKGQQEHSEGLSAGEGLLSKIPGIGKTLANSMDWYQSLLFRRYIPALKARGYELMFDRYQDSHPDWSVDRVAKAAASHTNNTFGGVNWKAMGRSATTQDWGRLLLLAPDWMEAEMRSGANLFNKEEGGLGRAQVAKMALGMWGVSRVLNLVSTGNPHLEAPFGLAVKNKEGKETVFSIRTLPTDLLHAASDPVGFLKGRLSPTIRTGEELVSGRDQYGRKMTPEDLWVDVFRNMSPIPLQSIGQVVSGTGPEVGNIGQTWKAIGGTAQNYSTPAQKLAASLASNHSEDGPVDQSQMARHKRVLQFEDAVRSGDMSWPDLMRLTYETDQLHENELKKIQSNVKATQGMTSDMASLFSRASRLPAKEYLDLLDTANASEKSALAKLTMQVQKRYLTKAKKDETPQERSQDPVFQKFLNMTPQPIQQQ